MKLFCRHVKQKITLRIQCIGSSVGLRSPQPAQPPLCLHRPWPQPPLPPPPPLQQPMVMMARAAARLRHSHWPLHRGPGLSRCQCGLLLRDSSHYSLRVLKNASPFLVSKSQLP